MGIIGATIILIAFLLNQTHIWSEEYFIYDFCNFVGSTLLIIYAVFLDSTPFIILNSVWAFVSLKDMITDLQRNSKRQTGGLYSKWMK